MKYRILIFLLTFSLAAQGQISKLLPEKPSPIKLVSDYTETLTKGELHILEQRLIAFRAATTNEIAVVVLPTINEYAIEDVALGIFRKWGIGRKDKNNGAILLVIKNDHKLRIQTGYGLEGSLTDVQCAHIMRNSIKPAFKNGDFYKGLNEGTMEIIRAIEPGYADSLNNIEQANISVGSTVQDSGISQQDTSNQIGVSNKDYENTQSQSNTGAYIGWGIFISIIGLVAIFGKRSNGNSDSGNNYSSSDSSSSSSDSSSDSSGGDFGGGDSGGGGSSNSW